MRPIALRYTLAIFTVFAVLVQLPRAVHPARILSVAFFSSKSHKLTYDPLLHALAARGHVVTVASPVPIAGEHQHKNLREISTIPVEEVMNQMTNFFEMRDRGEYINPFAMCMNRFGELCRRSYGLPQVQALLGQKYDLVILPPVFNECVAGLVHKFNTSLVLVSPFPVSADLAALFGAPSPPSFVPNMYAGLSDRMTLLERARNVYMELSYEYRQRWQVKPQLEDLYRELLGDSNIPSVDEILSNASLILSTSHFSIEGPRPLTPDIVEVGGMHCRPAKKLPADLEEFVNQGKDGFILFSMGSALKGGMLPDKYRNIFAEAFGGLPNLRVLWKWDEDTPPVTDLPRNVKLSKWLPQQDLLGHPKIRAFITHGGLGSVMESVYHAVPIVGIPIYGDQFMNVRQAAEAGYAVPLEFTQLTPERIVAAVNKILTYPKYSENIRALSSLYRDQPQTPLERAVFWVEYVIRHRGATRIRSPARELNFLEYHCLDLMLIALGVIAAAICLMRRILAIMLSWFKSDKRTDTKTKAKKN